MINAKTQKEIDRLSDDLISNFAPPEFVPGCKVTAITDKDEYATDNGWIVAICGRHNNQRCRWTGQLSSIAINDYVDVLYYPSYKLFVVFGQGGTSAAQSGKYLLTDGTRDSTGEQDFTAGIKADTIAESTAAAGVTVDGVLLKDTDAVNGTIGNGIFSRNITFGWGVTEHFRAATSVIPSGYTWDNTPGVAIYNYAFDYLFVNEGTANQRDFLYKAITTYTSKELRGRFALGLRNEIGLRIDDSGAPTTNFVEIYLTGVLANGTTRLDWRTGAGTVSSSIIKTAGEFLSIRLRHLSGTTLVGYVLGEGSNAYVQSGSGFTNNATWLASPTGSIRTGIFTKNTGSGGDSCMCDWFYSNFT